MIEYQEARRIAAMLAAVGEPTRMRVLHRLTERPHSVGELADAVGIPMVNMSHHLGVMRQGGILEDDKEGRRVIYRIRSDIYTPGGDEPDVVGMLQIGPYKLFVLKPEAVKLRPKAAMKPDKGKG